MGIGDIVRFTENAEQIAAAFCRAKGITGRIVREETGLIVVDVGFGYELFAKPDQLQLVALKNQIPDPVDIGN